MDNDNKKSTNGKEPNDHQMTAKSGVNGSTPFTPHSHPRGGKKSGGNVLAGYQTTEQVAKTSA